MWGLPARRLVVDHEVPDVILGVSSACRAANFLINYVVADEGGAGRR
jgi:hypothetical protein